MSRAKALRQRMAQSQQGSALANLPAFTPTEPGDPDFSAAQNPNSQAQLPAAYVERQQSELRTRASNTLLDASTQGADIMNPEFDQIREVADKGFSERALTFGEKLIGLIDGPRQFVNLAVQDIVGGDETSAGFGDYLDAMWMGVDDPMEFEARTGLDPISGSKTIEMFGWDEHDNWAGKIARGAADFTFQMLIDPITYLSFGFSALGKKVALEASEKASKTISKEMLSVRSTAGEIAEEGLTDYQKTIARQLPDLREKTLREMSEDPEKYKGVMDYLGHKLGVEDMTDVNRGDLLPELYNYIDEIAIEGKVIDDVMKPLMNRNFAAVPEEALEHLPAYAKGGARITVPFTQKTLETGILIPGTRGLGKKLVGDNARAVSGYLKKFKPYEKFADNMVGVAERMDQMRGTLKGLAKDDIRGWEWQIQRASQEARQNLLNSGAIHAGLHQAFKRIDDIAKPLEGAETSDILPALFDFIETGEVPDLPHFNQYAAAFQDASVIVKNIKEEYTGVIAEFNPRLATSLEGSMPHMPNQQGQEILRLFEEGGHTLDRATIDAMNRDGNPAGQILATLLRAHGGGGVSEARLGSIIGVGKVGDTGRLPMTPIVDNGAINMNMEDLRSWKQATDPILLPSGKVDLAAGPVRGHLSAVEMNEILAPVVKDIAERRGVRLPKNWDGKIFNDNPFEVMATWVDNLTESINQWNMIGALRDAGLAVPQSSIQTTSDIVETMLANLHRSSENVKRLVMENIQNSVSESTPNTVPLRWLENLEDPINAKDVAREADLGLEGTRVNRRLAPELPSEAYGRSSDTDGAVISASGEIALKYNPELGEFGVPTSHMDAANELGLEVGSDDSVILNASGYFSATTHDWDALPDIAKQRTAEFFKRRSRNTFNLTETAGDGRVLDVEEILAELEAGTRHGTVGEMAEDMASRGFDPDQPIRISVDQSNRAFIVDGHHRLEAARRAGLEDVPVEFMRTDLGPMHDTFPGVDIGEHLREGANLPDEAIIGQQGERQFSNIFESLPWSPHQNAELVERKFRMLKGFEETQNQQRNKGRVALRSIDEHGFDPSNPEQAREVVKMALEDPEMFKSRIRFGTQGSGGLRQSRLSESAVDAVRASTPVTDGAGMTVRNLEGLGEAVVHHAADGSSLGVSKFSRENDIISFSAYFNDADDIGFDGYEQFLDSAAQNLHEQMMRHGGMTSVNLAELVSGTQITEAAADVIQRMMKRSVEALDNDALEGLMNGVPAELARFNSRMSEFSKVFNEIMTVHGKAFDPETGQIFPRAPSGLLRISPDDEMYHQIKHLQGLAEELEIPEMNRIFDGLDREIPIADRPGFIDPHSDGFKLGGPAVNNLQIQADMAKMVRNMARNASSIYSAEGLAMFKQSTSAALRAWKGLATVARPTFHIRNLLGGVYNNQIVGVRTSDYVKTSTNGLKFRKALQEGFQQGDTIEEPLERALLAVDEDVRDAFRAAWEEGVLNGFSTTEFRRFTVGQSQKAIDLIKPWDPEGFALTRAGGRVMESVEDFLRMSAFVRHFDPADPSTKKVAREMANATQYDYNALTPWETRMKEFIPFFVWTRRNLPRQLEVLAENPKIIQRYRNMMQAMNDNFGGDDPGTELPESDQMTAFAAGTNWKVNEGTPFWGRIMIDPDLPVRDLINLPNPNLPDLAQFGADLLGPQFTSIQDLLTQREFGDVNAPASFMGVVKGLSYLGMYDRTMDGDVRIPYWQRTLMETAMPFTRETAEPLVSLATGGPRDPSRQASRGIGQDAGRFESAAKSLGFGLARGLGISVTGPTDANRVIGRSRTEQADLASELRLAGILPPSQG